MALNGEGAGRNLSHDETVARNTFLKKKRFCDKEAALDVENTRRNVRNIKTFFKETTAQFEHYCSLAYAAIEATVDTDLRKQYLREFEELEYEQMKWQVSIKEIIEVEENAKLERSSQSQQSQKKNAAIALINSVTEQIKAEVTELEKIPASDDDIPASTVTTTAQHIEDLKKTIDGPLYTNYQKLIEITNDHETHTNDFAKVRTELMKRLVVVKVDIAKKQSPNNSVVNNGASTPMNLSMRNNDEESVQPTRSSNYYEKRKLTKFNGDPRSYARWSREWKESIAKAFSEEQCLLALEDCTPMSDRISSFDTLKE